MSLGPYTECRGSLILVVCRSYPGRHPVCWVPEVVYLTFFSFLSSLPLGQLLSISLFELCIDVYVPHLKPRTKYSVNLFRLVAIN